MAPTPTTPEVIDPTKLKKLPNAVTIDENNLSTGIVLKQRHLLNNPNLWHKITIHNCPIRAFNRFTRNFLLKRILMYLDDLDFIPVCYYREEQSAHFFVRNCRMAIEKLCQQNLMISNVKRIRNQNLSQVIEPQHVLKLSITLGYTDTTQLVINVQDNITEVLQKHYTPLSKTLNLEHFHQDNTLKEFCALSQPKILYFVLHLSKQFQHMQTLKLASNEIRILSPMECICNLKFLTILDLRNNWIADISELKVLKNMHITDLGLDGNPICNLYDDYTYVQAIKEVCPTLEKLDGVLLGQNGFRAFRRNYLCNVEGKELVDQFLEHYFTLYDASNRSVLSGIYHNKALFSLTCNYIPGQSSTATASLGQYKCISRNLKLLSDLARSEEYLIRGNQNIIKALMSLPPTEHDPYTFTVDLVHYTPRSAMLTVTGVYREVAQSLLDIERVIGFTRTFVLAMTSFGEFNITNEQLHVSNATTAQQQRAFKVVRVPRSSALSIEPPTTVDEKTELENALKAITNLNLEWSKKCLEECRYDLKEALKLFVSLYKVDKIPVEAFEEEVEDLVVIE